jgi:hypothetical protein
MHGRKWVPMDKENYFSHVVSANLQCYVYRLIDPRSGSTFYIGRGQGNRVFSHAAGNEKPATSEEAKSLKLDMIRAIKADGFQVVHVVHRHGMNDEIAKEVEAALIDAYPGLANIQPGYDSQRGAMHAMQVIRLYEAEEAIFTHRVVLIKIDRSLKENPMIPIVDAVRYAWAISEKNARKAEYVLAVAKGMIVGAFIAVDWLPARPENFPGFPLTDPERFGFVAGEAPEEVKALYLQKRLPAQSRGAANPIRYEPRQLWESSR